MKKNKLKLIMNKKIIIKLKFNNNFKKFLKNKKKNRKLDINNNN